MKRTLKFFAIPACIASILLLTACSGSGGGNYRTYHSYDDGYGRYYGARPWGHHPGYIGGIPGPGIDDGPVAVPLPEMGMPDYGGGMDMGMGMGGFDF